MTTLHVLRADLTLSVKNLFEDTVFGSQTISLQANGKSMEACMRSLINKVTSTTSRFAKLIGDVQQASRLLYAPDAEDTRQGQLTRRP